MKKYIAEALGTATLTLAVGLSLTGAFPVPTPVIAALTLGLFVYSIGHISGTHINPAVTIGAWSIKKISNEDALAYVAAQALGAVAAMMFMDTYVAMPALTVADTAMVGFAEALGAALFTFGIASVVYGRAPGQVSGLVVGGSLLLGIAVATLLGSNGVLNPAVAFGIGSMNVMYLLGPVLGAVAGMQAYKRLQ